MKRLQRQRKNSSSLRLFVLIFTITLGLVVSSSVVPTYTQPPKLITQDACKSQIEKQAKNDVENEIKDPRTKFAIDLYKSKCPTLDESQIGEIYDKAFQKEKEFKNKDWRELLKPEKGLILFIILFIGTALGAAFSDTLKNGFISIFKRVWNPILDRISGFKIFRYFTLKRYREALKENYEKLKISFRPNKPLNIRDIYVPLKVTGTADSDLIDAFQAVGKYHRLMVTGSPGSGKTMLLKYITLGYASRISAKLFKEFQCVPILVELYRFSSNEKMEVKDQLVEALKRNGFPNSERFISQSLKNNRLLLLLDGLDEVSSDERDQVVGKINDFLETYKKCPVIITCRTAVYRGEFNKSVEQTLEVVEFSDQQIRDFLGSWKPDMRLGKSVEQLMQTLHDRPRIMTLARNPLMLTIIAYLYADTALVLPHSRAEFYGKSTEILLEQWHQERNQYKERDKKQILQHLALFFQDNANNQGQDRRSVDSLIVESEVKSQLPYLNLLDSDINPLLTEIVERSGLLLAIDGGERYQFAHLTLQEFFAASKLREDPNDLITHFKKDPDAWRETIKLWCGIADHNTDLIREVNVVDPITAFECLADAKSVDSTLANQIINNFKSQLGTDGNEDRVNHAFASVAADEKRRKDIFTFLSETLKNTSETEARRKAAANALSLTNLPSAAEVLVEQYKLLDEGELYQTLYQALIRMGDIAVPKIENAVNGGSIPVMDTLVDIGTPSALQALVSWLYIENENISLCAALLLGSLLKNQKSEKMLNDCRIPPNVKRKEEFDWVWQRVEKQEYPKIPIISGQIAYLISKQLSNPVSKEVKQLQISTLDIKIVYPIVQSLEKTQQVFCTVLPESIHSYEEYLDNLFKKYRESDLCKWLLTRNFSPWQLLFINLITTSLPKNKLKVKNSIQLMILKVLPLRAGRSVEEESRVLSIISIIKSVEEEIINYYMKLDKIENDKREKEINFFRNLDNIKSKKRIKIWEKINYYKNRNINDEISESVEFELEEINREREEKEDLEIQLLMRRWDDVAIQLLLRWDLSEGKIKTCVKNIKEWKEDDMRWRKEQNMNKKLARTHEN